MRWLACLAGIFSLSAGASDLNGKATANKSVVNGHTKPVAKLDVKKSPAVKQLPSRKTTKIAPRELAVKVKPAVKQLANKKASAVVLHNPAVTTAVLPPALRGRPPAPAKNTQAVALPLPSRNPDTGPLAAARQSSMQIGTISMDQRWKIIQETLRPNKLTVLCENFDRDFPGSPYSDALGSILAGARKAVEAQRVAELSSDALEEPSPDTAYRQELIAAVRGSHMGAFKVAQMYRDGSNGLPKDTLRYSQWLRFSAELGNGVASWEVATLFNYAGRIGDAAHYEAKALKFGYQPPKRLPSRSLSY